ncbi:MAG TPA: hypothetical protein VI298_14370 [Geobacteraceae bacterium]
MLRKALAAATIIAAGFIAGCGSGGGTAASTVSGVAATGAPMSGTVYLKDAAGSPEMSAQINPQTGAFAFDVSGKTPPFMIRTGALYSMSGGSGTANINPLSNLMVANTTGFGNMSAMTSFYKNPDGTTMRAMFGNLSTARLQMRQTMGSLLTAYGVANVDPITSPYAIGRGLDLMFDNVAMSIDQHGNVTMMNTSGATIYSGPMGNISGGTMMSGNIMPMGTGQTVSGITITPANATVPANGTLQFSANIPVTWSVGLNSGAITSGGLYTAPSFQGMFLVKATSVADPTKSATATVFVGGMGMM